MLHLIEYVIENAFRTLPNVILDSLNSYKNSIIQEYWSGNKSNSHTQNSIVDLFGIKDYPLTLLQQSFANRQAHLKVLYKFFPEKVTITHFIEKFFLLINLEDLPRLLPPNTTISLYAIDNEMFDNYSKVPLFTCEISYTQVKQNFADFAIVVKVIDPNNPTIPPLEFIICKDVKSASTDGGTSGRLSILPDLNTDLHTAKQYMNGILGLIGQIVYKVKLNPNKILSDLKELERLYKILKKIQSSITPTTVQSTVEDFLNQIKYEYTNPNILKYINFSLCVDLGIDTNYSLNILPDILNNITKNADLLDAFYGKGDKTQLEEGIKKFIEATAPNEETKKEMIEKYNKYIKYTPENNSDNKTNNDDLPHDDIS